MNKLLIFYDYFSPAYKAGGPIRSLNNLTNLLHQDLKIFVYTSAVDLDQKQLTVEPDKWVEFRKNVMVFYATKRNLQIPKIHQVFKSIQPEIVYINGLFTPYAVLFPLIALKWYHRSQAEKVKVVLAPRGMLQQGALALKAGKKNIYLKVFKLLGLHKDIHWHATDRQEQEDIKFFAGPNAAIKELSNVPVFPIRAKVKAKIGAKLRLVTISLLARKKNHHFLLKCLKELPKEVTVQYDIYGPVKDSEYGQLLEREIKSLPSHVQVTYKGAIQPDQVIHTLQQYDAFVLPTLGENFGHAIFEALGAGIPVFISEQTPWKGLENKKAGWDLALQEELWIAKLAKVASMPEEEYQNWREGASRFALDYLAKQNLKEQYMAFFGAGVSR